MLVLSAVPKNCKRMHFNISLSLNYTIFISVNIQILNQFKNF